MSKTPKPPLLVRIRLYLVSLLLGDVAYVHGVEVRGIDTVAGVVSGEGGIPLVLRCCTLTNEGPPGIYALSKEDLEALRSMS